MNALIQFSLQHRLLVVAVMIATLIFGGAVTVSLPIDIFPNLTRPRVTVMTECAGLAPEEVETLVTLPLETALNGAAGVQNVRTSSGIGLSIVYVEFDWKTDIYRARQVVNERLATVVNRLPTGVKPELGPIASIMGQIMMIGFYSETGETSPMDVRSLADWTIRPRLLAIPGIAQVIVMGGERKQFQVLVHPEALIAYGISLDEVEKSLGEANQNSTGGFMQLGAAEYPVRAIGRVKSVDDLAMTVVKRVDERSVLIKDIATIREGAQLKRGDSSVNGHQAVVLTIGKQPTADTRELTEKIERALRDIQPSLPKDLRLDPTIFQQRTFIDLGVHNVLEALRDGAVLVLIVLFLFLMNFRTTMITLTAIPLSIVITGLVFYWSGLSINVMTLGGIAVAMGELVDDAIVDIENVFRRLHENALLPTPKPLLEVVYAASLEIRGAIVFGTILVILVFVPLFALSGIEGRLFAPLGVAYIVSILASLLVSLTVTPVLASLLLSGPAKREAVLAHDPAANPTAKQSLHAEHDSWLLKQLKWLVTPVIRTSLSARGLTAILTVVFACIIGSGIVVTNLGRDFLPPFDEGAAQVNVLLPPGASLASSNRVCGMVDRAFKKHLQTAAEPHGIIRSYVRRTGRAELDEHVEGVNHTEYVLMLNPDNGRSREEVLAELREELHQIAGIEYEVEQPLAHQLSHMLSGVTAQIAIKIFGDDLDILRRIGLQIRDELNQMDGIAPPLLEPQQLVPQIRIELNREQLALYGLTPRHVTQFVETALAGRTVSSILEGQRSYDLVLRIDDIHRNEYSTLERLPVDLPDGTRVPLSAVAKVYPGGGPNTINRENVRRRITLRVNTTGRDLGGAVDEIKRRISGKVELPPGYFIQYGGQFEAQQEATQLISLLSLVSLAGVFIVLYVLFASARIVLQVMFALPIAFVGGVLALKLTGQTLTVASMVGFISLGGIAARNGILLVSHYLHLMREEGEDFTEAMVLRGSLERLAPVLMTALTAGIGLVPLVIGGQQPGKEILYPVATVILGGLITSTICEYVVHPGLFFRLSGRDALRLAHHQGTALDPTPGHSPGPGAG